jgi:hypothetical protein
MTTHHHALALACFAGLGAAALGAEFVGSDAPAAEGSVATPTDNLERIPLNAYQPPRGGVPFHNLFRDTGAPYYNALRDVQVNPIVQPSQSVEVKGHADIPDFRGRFPLLQRGFAPEDADLKIGPLYFKLKHLSVGVLYSDNINHDDTRKEADTIGIVSLGGQVLAQLSEGFHIAVAGNLVYLPFEGTGGANGLGLVAPYGLGLNGVPTASAQVAWEPVIFGLPFVIADEFTTGLARFSNTGYDSFELFDGFDTDSVDRAGIYTLRAPPPKNFRESDRDRNTQDDFEFLYYSNTLSLNTGGPFPGESVFRFRAAHENIWYEENGNNLPDVRDRVNFHVDSVRENLRFKPYFDYEFLHTEDPDRTGHTARIGVRGPVTDLIFFRGDVGYYFDPDRDNSNFVWSLRLSHTPTPRLKHTVIFERNTSDFLDELDTRAGYNIRKVIGPNLTGAAYITYAQIEDLDHVVPDRDETRAGLMFNYIQSPRTQYRLIGEYVDINYENGFGSNTVWRGRAEIQHQFVEKLYARLVYQYQHRSGNQFNAPTFSENLLYLTMSWIFD